MFTIVSKYDKMLFMWKRIIKICRLIKYIVINPKYLILYLIKVEAQEHLKTFYKMGIGNVEDIEDLIYHIDSYIEIPKVLQSTTYAGYLEKGEKLDEYFEDLETHRAVERDYIFEALKRLPIGFQL